MADRPVLGIDLGTTYSCVAQLDVEVGRPSVLANSEGEYTTPSVVYYSDEGDVVVGKMAKQELALQSDRVVQLIKRHMGKDGYTVPVGDQELLPQQVSAVILRYVVEDALTELGFDIPAESPLADVVITVPAYFGSPQRQATHDAGKMAGLNVLNIINEPTAAAIAYGVSNAGQDKSVLVYDLGGGTFDVTVIKVKPEEIRVVATGGDSNLGGANWDERIQDLLAEEFTAEYPDLDPRTDQEAGSLALAAEDAKKALSRKESHTLTVTAHGERAKIELSRRGIVDRTADLVDRTVDFTREVWRKAQAKGVEHLDELLLVGGMSRMPAVAERLKAEFPDFPEPRLVDPEQIVAKGAALYAFAQVREVDEDRLALPGPTPPHAPKIINVTSKGYGVKVVDNARDTVGHVDWLIKPDDELPTGPRETYGTVSDNQVEVEVVVFESIREAAAGEELSPAIGDHLELIRGILKGIPRKRAGQPVEVSYDLGEDGVLTIHATSHGQVLRLEATVSGATPKEVLDAPLPNISRM